MSKKFITLRNKNKDTCFIYPNIDPEHNIPDGSIPLSKLQGDIDLSQYAKKLYPTFSAEDGSSIVADFVGKQFNERAMIRFIGKDGDWLGWIGVSGGAPQFVNRAGAIHQIVTLDTSEFKNKLDKTAEVSKVYGTNASGSQTLWSLSSGNYGNTIPIRLGSGALRVGTPTEDSDATTKKYVDDLLKTYVHNIKLKSTDTTVTLQIIDKSSTAYTLATLMTYLEEKGFNVVNNEYHASGCYGSSFRPISGISKSGSLNLLIYHSNTFSQVTASNFTLTDIPVEV